MRQIKIVIRDKKEDTEYYAAVDTFKGFVENLMANVIYAKVPVELRLCDNRAEIMVGSVKVIIENVDRLVSEHDAHKSILKGWLNEYL